MKYLLYNGSNIFIVRMLLLALDMLRNNLSLRFDSCADSRLWAYSKSNKSSYSATFNRAPLIVIMCVILLHNGDCGSLQKIRLFTKIFSFVILPFTECSLLRNRDSLCFLYMITVYMWVVYYCYIDNGKSNVDIL